MFHAVFSHPHLLGGCFSDEGGTGGRTFESVDALTRLDSLAFASFSKRPPDIYETFLGLEQNVSLLDGC